MPEYTRGGIQYPLALDLIKQSSVVAKLANDMRALATTADSAVSVEGERAETAAATSAAAKYDAPIATLQDRTDVKGLGSTNLDTVDASGLYVQAFDSNVVPANNYPDVGGIAGRAGTLYVAVFGNVVYHEYSMGSAGLIFTRRRSVSGSWSSWQRIGKPEVSVLGSEILDNVTTSGNYVMRTDSGATTAKKYPKDAKAGHLSVFDMGGSVIYQTYTSPLIGKIWTRRDYIGSWSEWLPVGSGASLDEDKLRSDFKAADAVVLAAAKTYADTHGGVAPGDLTGVLVQANNTSANGDTVLSDRIDGHNTRIGALETLGGLEPGDVSDATVADLLSNLDTTTATALREAILGELVDPTTPAGSYLDSNYTGTADAHATFVSSHSVRRLITDPNARVALQPGDLLIQEPARKLTTTFYKTVAGAAPAQWSKRWGGASAKLAVTASPEAYNGKLLQLTGSSGRNFFSWDVPETGTDPDVELLVRWRTPSTGTLLQVGVHGSGAGGSENLHYFTMSDVGSISWWTLTNGSAGGGLGDTKTPIIPGEWWLYRMRFFHETIYFKAWRDGIDTEPEAWDANPVRSENYGPGWVGLGASGTGTIDIDWASIAFSGGIANGLEV